MALVRSENSQTPVLLKFWNLTGRKINLMWVNYTGQYTKYQDLEPLESYDIKTYKTHPWLAFDAETCDRMHIDKQFVYYPKTWREFLVERGLSRRYREGIELRIVVPVTLPVYCLRHIALLKIRDILNKPEDVDLLELPEQLSNDLKKIIQVKINNIGQILTGNG